MCAQLWAGPLRAAQAKDNGLLGLHCHSRTRLAASATSATLFAPQKAQTSQDSSASSSTDRAEYSVTAHCTVPSGFRIERRKLHHRSPVGYSWTKVQRYIWVRTPHLPSRVSSLRKWPARHYFGMGMHLVPFSIMQAYTVISSEILRSSSDKELQDSVRT